MTQSEIPPPAAWSGLLDSAPRWGALAWSEERLSELLASRAAGSEDPRTTVDLARMARRHSARAAAVRDRLPELRELPVDRVVGPGSAEWEAVLADLATEADDAGALAAYAGRVLPALAGAYRSAGAAASPVAEPSVRRCLLALGDEVDDDVRRWGGIDGGDLGDPPPGAEVVLGPPGRA